jgi:hypothetical protein
MEIYEIKESPCQEFYGSEIKESPCQEFYGSEVIPIFSAMRNKAKPYLNPVAHKHFLKEKIDRITGKLFNSSNLTHSLVLRR